MGQQMHQQLRPVEGMRGWTESKCKGFRIMEMTQRALVDMRKCVGRWRARMFAGARARLQDRPGLDPQ